MSVIDFNEIIFIVLIIVNIVLCIKKVPILGFSVGFFTMLLSGSIFLNDININVYFSYFLIIIGFSCMVINGLDFRRKK
jgi:hypothetical protein